MIQKLAASAAVVLLALSAGCANQPPEDTSQIPDIPAGNRALDNADHLPQAPAH